MLSLFLIAAVGWEEIKDWGTGVVEGVFNPSLHGKVLTKWIFFLQLFCFLLKTRG